MDNLKAYLEYSDNVGKIYLDGKDCFFDEKTLETLEDSLIKIQELIREGTINTLIFYSKHPQGFCLGFDPSLVLNMANLKRGLDLTCQIEDLEIRTVALLHGAIISLGLSLVLSFRDLYCAEDEGTYWQINDPLELGLCPSWGGSWRFPRRLGLERSLEMMTKSSKMRLTDIDDFGEIKKWLPLSTCLRGEWDEKNPVSRWSLLQIKTYQQALAKIQNENFVARGFIFNKVREAIVQKRKFYSKPLRQSLKLMEEYFGSSREEALASELKLLEEIINSKETKNLLSLAWHKHQIMANLNQGTSSSSSSSSSSELRVGLIGVGVMGSAMAFLMARRGARVFVTDQDQRGLESGLQKINNEAKQFLLKNSIHGTSQDLVSKVLRRIKPCLDKQRFKTFSQLDVVLESVPESLSLKKEIFREVESQVAPETILLTDTSSLSIGEIAKSLKRPSHFAGMHFFWPLHRNKLVEVVIHEQLSKKSLKKILELAASWDRIPILVRDAPGFLVGRLLIPYLNEAIYLLADGLSPSQVDESIMEYGFSMGPLRMMDELGLDFVIELAQTFQASFGMRSLLSVLSDSMVNNRILGKKTGRGFYLYQGDRVLEENPLIEKIFGQDKTKRKFEGKEKDIINRLLLPVLNESTCLLNEGIAQSASDIDLAAVLGMGFPPWMGGPLRTIEQEGAAFIVEKLNELSQRVDDVRFRPSILLLQMSKKV